MEAWKNSISLVKEMYGMLIAFPEYEKYTLTQQIRRAVISAPSDIAKMESCQSVKVTSSETGKNAEKMI